MLPGDQRGQRPSSRMCGRGRHLGTQGLASHSSLQSTGHRCPGQEAPHPCTSRPTSSVTPSPRKTACWSHPLSWGCWFRVVSQLCKGRPAPKPQSAHPGAKPCSAVSRLQCPGQVPPPLWATLASSGKWDNNSHEAVSWMHCSLYVNAVNININNIKTQIILRNKYNSHPPLYLWFCLLRFQLHMVNFGLKVLKGKFRK